LINFEFKTFDWINFSIEEKEIFRSVVQWSKVESDPSFLGDGMVKRIEFWFAESSGIHPHPFPVPSTASEPIKSTSCLISFWVESTKFLLVLLIILIKINEIQSNFSVSISTEAFVWNYSISDNSCTLIVSSDMSIIGIKLNFVLICSQVEWCYCFRMTSVANSLWLPNYKFEVSFFDIHIQRGFIEILWKSKSDFFLNFMWANLMSPVIDLYKTGISKINKINFEFIKIVLNKNESVDFFTTLLC